MQKLRHTQKNIKTKIHSKNALPSSFFVFPVHILNAQQRNVYFVNSASAHFRRPLAWILSFHPSTKKKKDKQEKLSAVAYCCGMALVFFFWSRNEKKTFHARLLMEVFITGRVATGMLSAATRQKWKSFAFVTTDSKDCSLLERFDNVWIWREILL